MEEKITETIVTDNSVEEETSANKTTVDEVKAEQTPSEEAPAQEEQTAADPITALCENFIENRDTIKKVFRGESVLIYPVASNAITTYGLKAEEDKLRECKKIIRKNAGTLSYLKGIVATPFAATLSLKEDPKAHFDKVAKIYAITKKQFSRSEYSALLAIMLADIVDESKVESVVARGKEIYSLMKEQHPFLTNDSDSVFAGLLALSEKNNRVLIDDMEKCYDLLKIKFSNKSSIHSVSHILALTEGPARQKVEHLIDLYDALKASGRKFGTYTELAILAAASILDDDVEKLRDTILQIDQNLSKQKGYGFFGLDKKTRLMHSAMLATDLYDSAQNAQAVSTASAIAMAAAQQVAICVIIASTAANVSYYSGD